ncbi:MAG: hypothetical protein R6V52_05495, partial [Bacteroidales bacterium]
MKLDLASVPDGFDRSFGTFVFVEFFDMVMEEIFELVYIVFEVVLVPELYQLFERALAPLGYVIWIF